MTPMRRRGGKNISRWGENSCMKSPTKAPSKFDAIFERKRGESPVTEVSQAQRTVPDKEERKGPGRPRGKRSSPQYDQVTAYIPHGLPGPFRSSLSGTVLCA